MKALLNNITSEEFKNKIIIILGGYEEDAAELFSLNPGFQSRFDKQRIYFPSWTGRYMMLMTPHLHLVLRFLADGSLN